MKTIWEVRLCRLARFAISCTTKLAPKWKNGKQLTQTTIIFKRIYMMQTAKVTKLAEKWVFRHTYTGYLVTFLSITYKVTTLAQRRRPHTYRYKRLTGNLPKPDRHFKIVSPRLPFLFSQLLSYCQFCRFCENNLAFVCLFNVEKDNENHLLGQSCHLLRATWFVKFAWL